MQNGNGKHFLKYKQHFDAWQQKIFSEWHHAISNKYKDYKSCEPVEEHHSEYRNIDGSDNNNNYNGTGEQFLRYAPDDSISDYSQASGDYRPSARVISNELFAQDSYIPDPFGASDMFWVWGQFIDHDITLTGEASIHESFSIPVPFGDPYFDPFYTGTQTISLTRSGYDEHTGEEYGTMRQQTNEITAFIDASMVYGSDATRNAALRGEGGKLKLSDNGMLPYNEDGLPNAPHSGSNLFLAGDVRANENVALTSMHLLFVKEHNRIVDELKVKHPYYSDEKLYQEAKIIVEAEIQKITYKEFLPLLLGENALKEYSGYKADVDPQIANIFATAAFRLGHSMLSSKILRLEENGNEAASGHLELRHAFFNPSIINMNGGNEEMIFRGLAAQNAQDIDLHLIDDVRNFLFGPPGAGGFDLGSLNIQRGRDHNLADYNSAREYFGLERVTSFSEITSDIYIQQKLAALFGSVDNIDVFVGGLAEDAVAGSMLGELFHTIVADQFERLRDGDYYWYENRLSEHQMEYIKDITLADIIMQNSDVDYMQQYAMLAYNRIGGDDSNDVIYGTNSRDLILGFNGNDVLKGKAGDDEIYGGKGNDKIYGNAGNDKLYGEHGNDKIYGGKGDDIINGGDGNDKIHGGKGNDTIYGSQGRDIIDMGGSSDQDVLFYHDIADGYDIVKNFDNSGKWHDVINLEKLFDNMGVAKNTYARSKLIDINSTGYKNYALTIDSDQDGKFHDEQVFLKISVTSHNAFLGIGDGSSSYDDIVV